MGAAGCRPTKLRVLDLPFTAVEWVVPLDRPLMQQATPDQWVAWQRSPHAGGLSKKQKGTEENKSQRSISGRPGSAAPMQVGSLKRKGNRRKQITALNKWVAWQLSPHAGGLSKNKREQKKTNHSAQSVGGLAAQPPCRWSPKSKIENEPKRNGDAHPVGGLAAQPPCRWSPKSEKKCKQMMMLNQWVAWQRSPHGGGLRVKVEVKEVRKEMETSDNGSENHLPYWSGLNMQDVCSIDLWMAWQRSPPAGGQCIEMPAGHQDPVHVPPPAV